MELTNCIQVCPYNTLRGCIKDEANGGVCILVKTAVKPILKDHDHEDYFSKSVECGECNAWLGSWDYGRAYCNGSKERFIENHRFCNRCGKAIDWRDYV